jgi:hypothetical protein
MLFRPSRSGEHRRWTAAAVAACGALGIVLVLLALAQYRQVDELRQAERRQLDIALRATAERFAEDFTSELLRVATAFRLEHESEGDPLTGQIEDGYEQWIENTDYPQLIREVMVFRPEDESHPISRFHFG